MVLRLRLLGSRRGLGCLPWPKVPWETTLCRERVSDGSNKPISVDPLPPPSSPPLLPNKSSTGRSDTPEFGETTVGWLGSPGCVSVDEKIVFTPPSLVDTFGHTVMLFPRVNFREGDSSKIRHVRLEKSGRSIKRGMFVFWWRETGHKRLSELNQEVWVWKTVNWGHRKDPNLTLFLISFVVVSDYL